MTHPPCDRSYATAPSIHKLFGLPPVPTTIPPAAEPPSCHSVLPDHTATMEIVQQGFWSVPCTTYLSASGTGITSCPLCTTCTLCTCHGFSITHCTCTLHASTGVATRITHTAHGSHTPLVAPPAPSAPVMDPPSRTACAPYMPAPVPPLASCTRHMAPIPYTTPLTYPTVVPAPVPHTKPAPMPMVVLTAAPRSLHHVDLLVVDLAVVQSTSQPSVPFYRSGLAPHLTSLPMPKPFVPHATPVTLHTFTPSTSALIPQVAPPSVFAPMGPPWSSSLASMPPALFF